ncbi:MAG: hypothetical protein ABI878_12520 [Acidobacteriota bacterium]
MRRVLLFVFCLAPLLIAGCSKFPVGQWEGKEFSRVTSADCILDAVLVEGSVDATTSESSRVFIVPKGTQYKTSDPLFAVERASFVADHVRDLKLYWEAKRVLALEYQDARIFHYSNFASMTGLDGRESGCEIRLHWVDNVPVNTSH